MQDNTKIENMCFMAIGESSEVRPFNYYYCNIFQSNLYMITDELRKAINKYKNIEQEKRNQKTHLNTKLPKKKKIWKILLEASQIEVDLLQEELDDLQMQLNSIKNHQVTALSVLVISLNLRLNIFPAKSYFSYYKHVDILVKGERP